LLPVGMEIQLYESKKMAWIGRFRGHLPARMPGRGESRLRRGSTTSVAQRCWRHLFRVGAHAPVVVVSRTVRAHGFSAKLPVHRRWGVIVVCAPKAR
jgi:hypothetical protein